MGLNEIGVQILIEELGAEEFAEFVYDISEEYYLTEARAGGDKIEPVTTKGNPFVDPKKIPKSSLARLRAKKEEKRAVEASERPSGMKAALQRQDAMVSASKQQPKRKGLLNSVASVVLDGFKKHKAATDGMGAATIETVGKIGKAAREFGTGLMSSYDNWVGQLISDGYDLSNWTDEGLFEYYEQLCEENGVLGNIIDAGAGAVKKPIENFANRKVGGIAGALGIPGQIAGQKVDQTAQQLKDKDFRGALKTVGGLLKQSYEYDLYDTILEYLISEGYADTNEAALAIMASMSEDWKYSIVEAAADQSDKQIDQGIKKTYKAQNVLDNLHQGSSPGLNRLPRGERTAKKKRMEARLKQRRDDLFGERRNREDASRAEMGRKYGP
jgi:hypothetical protein